MSMQDPISDMLTRIRNGQQAHHTVVRMPSSNAKVAICQVLADEGYIDSYQVDEEKKPTLSVQLKYHSGTPVIEEAQAGQSTGPAHLSSGGRPAERTWRSRRRHRVDQSWRHDGSQSARWRAWVEKCSARSSDRVDGNALR